MLLTPSQLELLHILWAADAPLSLREIAERSRYRIASKFIVSIIIENLLVKEAVYRAGVFHSYSGKRETVFVQYSANIRFDEYYAERFQHITPQNFVYLMERIIQSDKCSPKQLRELSSLLNEKINLLKSNK